MGSVLLDILRPLMGGGGASLTASASSFLASASTGTIVAVLSNPFGAGTTYATVGSVPGQLSLSGAQVLKGASSASEGSSYALKVRATSLDGKREVSETFVFTAAAAAGPGPGPGPAEEPVLSVSANGLFLTMANTPASANPDYSVTVRRTGYTAAGQLTTWDQQVRLPARRSLAGYSTNTFAGTDVVPQKVIFAGDTFPNQPGVINNSTRTPPTIEARWITRGFQVVGSAPAPFELAVWGPYFRDGTPCARVEVVVTDQHGNSVVLPCTLTKWMTTRTALCVANRWITDTPDLSTLTDGDRLDVNYRLYGVYGQLIDSSAAGFVGNNAANIGWDISGTLYLYKRAAMAASPVYAYINPSASGGTASLDPAVARAAPFQTLHAARTAVMALNNSTYGVNAIDGAVFRWRDTGADLVVNIITGNMVAINAGATFEPDPLDTWTIPARLASAQFKFDSSSSALPNLSMGHHIRGFNWRFASGSQILSATTATTRVYVSQGEIDVNGAPDSVNFGSCGYVLRNMKVTNFTATTGQNMVRLAGGLIDVEIDNATRMVFASGHCALGVKGVNAGLYVKTGGALFASGVSLDGILVPSGDTRSISLTDGDTSRTHGALNCLLAVLDPDEYNASTFSADGGTLSYPAGVMLHHVTYPAKTYAARLNSWYNDTIGTVRSHRFTGFYGCVLPTAPSKGDWFVNVTSSFVTAYPDPAVRLAIAQGREDGWAEHGYGIGGGSNWQQWCSDRPGVDQQAVRYAGWNAVYPTATQSGLPITYLDSRVPTVLGGTAGTPGGNYRTLSTLPNAYERAAKWDLDGNDIPSLASIPGCYAGYHA